MSLHLSSLLRIHEDFLACLQRTELWLCPRQSKIHLALYTVIGTKSNKSSLFASSEMGGDFLATAHRARAYPQLN